MYIFIKSLTKNMIPKLGIGIATSIVCLALNAYWKRALQMISCYQLALKACWKSALQMISYCHHRHLL